MKFIAARIEILISILFLCVCQGLFWSPLAYFTKKQLPFGASDPFSVAAHASFVALLGLALIVRRDAMWAALRSAWLVAGLTALAFASAFWSEAPALVLYRSSLLAITSLFAVYLSARFEAPQLVSLLVKINAFGVAASLVTMAVAPHLASDATIDYPNALRGAYEGKNFLGVDVAFGTIFCGWALRRRYGSPLLAAACIPANLLLLHLSQSMTSTVLLVAATGAALLGGALRRRDAPGILVAFGLVVFGIAVLGFLAFDWDAALSALNRNATLTGRSQIWRMAYEFIVRRPWLGYGFGAFWRQGSPEAFTIWQRTYWLVPHAHNAWLEVGLNLGLLGIFGITLLWLAALYRCLQGLVRGAGHANLWFSVIAAVLIENLTEYEFLRSDSFCWVLFISGAIYVRRELLAIGSARGTARTLPLVYRLQPAGTVLSAPPSGSGGA